MSIISVRYQDNIYSYSYSYIGTYILSFILHHDLCPTVTVKVTNGHIHEYYEKTHFLS